MQQTTAKERSYNNYKSILVPVLLSIGLTGCFGGKQDNEPEEVTSFSVTATAGAGGSISPRSRTVQSGQTTSFTVTPYTGYGIGSVTGCNGSLSGTTYTTGTINAVCSVQASFTLNSYSVTATSGEGGSISPASQSVTYGGTTTFTLTPETGYSISSVTGCGGSLNGNIYTTGVITANCEINASFELNSFKVTTQISAGGSITPENPLVKYGEKVSFTIQPEPHFAIDNVTGCKGTLNGQEYQTDLITEACTVNASFKQVSQGSVVTVYLGSLAGGTAEIRLPNSTATESKELDDNGRFELVVADLNAQSANLNIYNLKTNSGQLPANTISVQCPLGANCIVSPWQQLRQQLAKLYSGTVEENQQLADQTITQILGLASAEDPFVAFNTNQVIDGINSQELVTLLQTAMTSAAFSNTLVADMSDGALDDENWKQYFPKANFKTPEPVAHDPAVVAPILAERATELPERTYQVFSLSNDGQTTSHFADTVYIENFAYTYSDSEGTAVNTALATPLLYGFNIGPWKTQLTAETTILRQIFTSSLTLALLPDTEKLKLANRLVGDQEFINVVKVFSEQLKAGEVDPFNELIQTSIQALAAVSEQQLTDEQQHQLSVLASAAVQAKPSAQALGRKASNQAGAQAATSATTKLKLIPNVLDGTITHDGSDANIRMDVENSTSLYYAVHKESDLDASLFSYFWSGAAIEPSKGIGFLTTDKITNSSVKTDTDISEYQTATYVYYNKSVNGRVLSVPNLYNTINILSIVSGSTGLGKLMNNTLQQTKSAKFIKQHTDMADKLFGFSDTMLSSTALACELYDLGVETTGRSEQLAVPGFDAAAGVDFCLGVSRARNATESLRATLESLGHTTTITEPDFYGTSPFSKATLSVSTLKEGLKLALKDPRLLLVRPEQQRPNTSGSFLATLVGNSAGVYVTQWLFEQCTAADDSQHGKVIKTAQGQRQYLIKELAKYAYYRQHYIQSFNNNAATYSSINPYYKTNYGNPESYLKNGLKLYAKQGGTELLKCSTGLLGEDWLAKLTTFQDVSAKVAKALAGQSTDISVSELGSFLAVLSTVSEEAGSQVKAKIAEIIAKQAATAAMGPFGIGVRLAQTGNAAGAMAWDWATKPSEIRLQFAKVGGQWQVSSALPALDHVSYLAFPGKGADSDNIKGIIATHHAPALGSFSRIAAADSDYQLGYLLSKDVKINHTLLTANTSFSYENQLLFDSNNTEFKGWLENSDKEAHFDWVVRHCPLTDAGCISQSRPVAQWPVFGNNNIHFSLTPEELEDEIQSYKRQRGTFSKTDNLTNPILWEHASNAKAEPVDELSYVDFTAAYNSKVGVGIVQHKTPGLYFDSTSATLDTSTFDSGSHVYVTLDYGFQSADAKSHNTVLKEQSYLLKNDHYSDEFGNAITTTKLVLRLERPEGQFNYLCTKDSMIDSCVNNASHAVWGQKVVNGPWQKLGDVWLGKGDEQSVTLPAQMNRIVLLDAITTAYLNNTATDVGVFLGTRLQQYQQGRMNLPFLTFTPGELTLFNVDFEARSQLQLNEDTSMLAAMLSANPDANQVQWYLVKGDACSEAVSGVNLPDGVKVNQLAEGYEYKTSRIRGNAQQLKATRSVDSSCQPESLVASGQVGSVSKFLQQKWSQAVTGEGNYYLILAVPNNSNSGQLVYLRSNVVSQLPELPIELLSGCDGSGACELLLNFDDALALGNGYSFMLNINGQEYQLNLQELASFGNELFTANLTRNADGRLVLKLQLKNAGSYQLELQVSTASGSVSLFSAQSVHIPKPTVKASKTSLNLQWVDLKASNYRVYISSQQGFDPSKVETYPDGQSFYTTDLTQQIESLETGKTYYLRLEAVLDNNSYFSGEISAVPAEVITASGKLNDTGISWCADGVQNNLACPVEGYAGQDGEHGRDALARAGQLQKVGGGDAGFDFTKLDASGNDLPASATEWSCVRDNHTGLIWEVKTTDGGLRDMNHFYTWYNPDNSTNGGSAGTQNGGSCTGSDCDTYAFVQAVNQQGLCGANDWRMPTQKELLGIVHNGQIMPAIDTHYFPNTPFGWFWSLSPYYSHYEEYSGVARNVSFTNGSNGFGASDLSMFAGSGSDPDHSWGHVRLVRTEQ
ncbi:DUF1566 domain-containing protein [Rheinheimera mangrovi]|uniref:DUF1566 domain-containing protein n=1 Tax=Rheinheimera mangrovi TaxID=2498451 RepID=UPI000F8C58F6|nr:DUF1566 domain-containing protein [Rheinheimera mangrovi]